MKLQRQRGVAVITALLLTTLAITIVASLFWQQQVQVRSMENQRLHLQTEWILRGALDWASLILRQDANDRPQTTLDGVWATPLAETRLDQYIERERVQDESFDATLSGRVQDAQARYNLVNLAANRVVSAGNVAAYARLLQNLQMDPSLAQRTADAMKDTQVVTSVPGPPQQVQQASTAPIEFMRLEDLLSIKGYTPEMVARLREFAIVLPEATEVNVNTAPAEVLAAVTDMSLSEAAALVVSRKQAFFVNLAGFTARLNGKTVLTDVRAGVRSDYFLVASRVRLDRAALDAEALMSRKTRIPSVIWIRQN